MTDLPIGDLAAVLQALLAAASPELFAGSPPAVDVALTSDSLTFAGGPRDDPAGARRESRRESLALDPQQPLGPYRLGAPPAPGHRVVRALAGDAVAFTLHDDEVDWRTAPDGQSFALTPRRHRSLTGVTHVQVVYAVAAAVSTLLGAGTTTVSLSGAAALVRRAQALALAVLTLDADRLMANVRVTVQEGDYTTSHQLGAVALTGMETTSTASDAATCRLEMQLQVQLETRRALRAGEGAPITRIATPGVSNAASVAIEPELDI